MKKIRLLILFLMLIGGSFMYNDTTVKVRGCAEAASGPDCSGNPGSGNWDNGCKCCSGASCKSGYCDNNTDKCAKKPNTEIIVEGPEV